MILRIRFFLISICLLGVLQSNCVKAQQESWSTERPRPAEWANLIFGGRFMDRFLPMPNLGSLTKETWGAGNVLPRDVKNGIEHKDFSFWCGSLIKGDDAKYHLFVCGWPEKAKDGHQYWPNSVLYNSVSDNPFGPFTVTDTIGKGHNSVVFKSKNGNYVVYVIDGYYTSTNCNGPWKYYKFDFQNRDRDIIEGLSNCGFVKREDGSNLMICRGGGIWISEDGLSSYHLITQKRAYPDIPGEFEDPAIWKDNVQYNLIVNDWFGRIAYYLRSKDGINWKVESGEAYMPGVARHEDGTVEDWFKFERIQIFQDNYGRATQANFAVIDVEKYYDKGNDIHSSKNIAVPIAKGRLLTILDNEKVTESSQSIRVKITAEQDFNPQKEIDVKSLYFGDPELVNYGKGGKVVKTEKEGNDLILTFDSKACNFSNDEFAAKLLGKTNKGKLIYGYARLPWVTFNEAILSSRFPRFIYASNGYKIRLEVQNFGQVSSNNANVQICYIKNDKEVEITQGIVPTLSPYQKTELELSCGNIFEKGVEYSIVVRINSGDKKSEVLKGKALQLK